MSLHNLIELGRHVRNLSDKTVLDRTESAGVSMRIDPAHVDQTAGRFDALADEVEARIKAVTELGTIITPAQDPVSTQAVKAYGEVAHGGPGEYLTNLTKLRDSLRATAMKMRSTAGQVRYTEETNTGNAGAAGRS